MMARRGSKWVRLVTLQVANPAGHFPDQRQRKVPTLPAALPSFALIRGAVALPFERYFVAENFFQRIRRAQYRRARSTARFRWPQ
jgi:hypothetical protein